MTLPALACVVLTCIPGNAMTPDTTSLFDFRSDVTSEWIVVNDGVMGGLSRSSLIHSDDGHSTFQGEVSLDNNGGFASVRGLLPEGLPDGTKRIELRVRGDGRTYQLRLRAGRQFDGIAYRAEFTLEEGEWRNIEIPLTAFEPTYRGMRPRNAPSLEPGAIRQLGLMIADKREGPFRLDVAWIRAIE